MLSDLPQRLEVQLQHIHKFTNEINRSKETLKRDNHDCSTEGQPKQKLGNPKDNLVLMDASHHE